MLKYVEYSRNLRAIAPSQLIFLLHGYGSNKHDLISLAPDLVEYLPKALFISFDAVDIFEGYDSIRDAYQWFSLIDRSEDKMLSGAVAASVKLEEAIFERVSFYGMCLSDVALIGFSQGAMMSLHIGLRLQSSVRGIIGYSGMLIAASKLSGDISSKPPVLLVHGVEDTVLPIEHAYHARDALKANGVMVDFFECRKLGHGISLDGIKIGGQFLNKIFNINSFSKDAHHSK